MTRRGGLQLLLVLLAGLLIYSTWLLPYRFPPREFVIGASYEVGFNNVVSFLAYATCVPLAALVLSGLLPPVKPEAPDEAAQGRVAVWTAAALILGHMMLFGALYAYKGRFVFGESLYFQSLLYRMSSGEIPYRDFSFYYGPLMLYPAYWLSLLVGLNLAYGIWFIVTYTLGLVVLYAVLGSVLREESTRACWFVFLALGLFNPLTGLNETFIRYLFPSAVFLVSASFVLRGGATRGAAAIILLAAAVAYTFEVAALSFAAVLLLWVAFGVGPRVLRAVRAASGGLKTPAFGVLSARTMVLVTSGVMLSVTFFLLVDPSGEALRTYPAIARSYSGGAHNTPIYPHLPFIALAGITVITLAVLAQLTLRGFDEVRSLAAAAYGVLALLAQRAAFGAAEPSHFAYFGLPIFCLGLFASSQTQAPGIARAWLAVILLVGIMLPMQYYHAMEFVPFFAHRLHVGQPKVSEAGVGDESGGDLEQQLRKAVLAVGVDRPYVMYEMEYSSLPVYRDLGLRYATYYTMLITARDRDGIVRVIDDVRRNGAVVVARKHDLYGLEPPQPSQGIFRVLDVLSGAHTAGSALNGVLMKSRSRLTEPFLEFIRTEYVQVYDRDGLVAYSPR